MKSLSEPASRGLVVKIWSGGEEGAYRKSDREIEVSWAAFAIRSALPLPCNSVVGQSDGRGEKHYPRAGILRQRSH